MRYLDIGFVPTTTENKKKKRLVLLVLALIFVAAAGYLGYVFYWPISSLLQQILREPGQVLSFFRWPNEPLKATDGQTNLLILGIDKREKTSYTSFGEKGQIQHNGFLSDTIIIASLDQKTKQTSLISIPRDTWVSLPGWNNLPPSSGKINSAYSLGNTYNYPGGGLKLAERVVSEHLGVPIHYGVRIDFEGFKKAIDILGGIDLVVDRSFDDYRYPLEGGEKAGCPSCQFEHIHFEAGPTHMNGTTALKYVRSRTGTNGEGSDFARARRQQKVLQAFLKRASSLKNLLEPTKFNQILREFGQAVETDFDFSEYPAAVKLAKEVSFENIPTLVLDPSSGLMTSPDPSLYGGAYVIVPRKSWDEIRDRVKKFLSKAAGAS